MVAAPLLTMEFIKRPNSPLISAYRASAADGRGWTPANAFVNTQLHLQRASTPSSRERSGLKASAASSIAAANSSRAVMGRNDEVRGARAGDRPARVKSSK
ncbi:hypothetical protein EVAR_93741_1 [Eumeta japonica]|uniref:Uncharacterized protein n=1 Tax=Eumeta variegata TaxID=151549 RepID=A0A4C1U3E7_EUMVA|nr:hypothetical protein EVAR_93741_1 [Eumeta japonica]